MSELSERVIEHVKRLPEGTPVSAKELLHLGSRAAIDQTLSRLSRRGLLMRAQRGAYVAPITTRFGVRAPSISQVVEALSAAKGEVIASHGAAAANALGLTTQVPVRFVYLTSGPSRKLNLGAEVIELRHAPKWQLALADRPAGEVVRALAWLGPEVAEKAIRTLRRKLPAETLQEVAAVRPRLPTWMAAQVSRLVADA